ncbi:MAG TPA: hypothetical protein VFY29_12555 [Terriglobia bacterium]|nr:hypothetical protein [Terriglobia bacterium]
MATKTKPKNIVRVMKPPSTAFNKHRPVSDLLWTQVEHLAMAVKKEIDDERRAVRTEEQASVYIQKMTALLNALVHPNR